MTYIYCLQNAKILELEKEIWEYKKNNVNWLKKKKIE
jgi:hypothetical protein